MAEQEQNRSEEATPHKLKEAQKRGQTARSPEVSHVAALAGLLLVLFSSAPTLARHYLILFQGIFSQAGSRDWSAEGMASWLLALLLACLQVLAPLFVALLILQVLAGLAQVGPIFSIDPLKPDLQRINPASGFKRLFSLRIVYEALKGVAKLLLLCALVWMALRALLPQLAQFALVETRRLGPALLGLVGALLAKLLLAAVVIVLVDVLYTRRQFARQMRMSKREITDEHKQRDGDPRIRNRIRQLRLEFLKKTRSLRALPQADVLLTNPTHFAVAISYKHGQMPAPKMLAKGAGEFAAKMRSTARRLRIPVVENPPLARELYKRLDADQYLPEDLYPQVARILLWIYAMRDARRDVQQGA